MRRMIKSAMELEKVERPGRGEKGERRRAKEAVPA
jgi:hypothetical protein